jgi:hypothetical protein
MDVGENGLSVLELEAGPHDRAGGYVLARLPAFALGFVTAAAGSVIVLGHRGGDVGLLRDRGLFGGRRVRVGWCRPGGDLARGFGVGATADLGRDVGPVPAGGTVSAGARCHRRGDQRARRLVPQVEHRLEPRRRAGTRGVRVLAAGHRAQAARWGRAVRRASGRWWRGTTTRRRRARHPPVGARPRPGRASGASVRYRVPSPSRRRCRTASCTRGGRIWRRPRFASARSGGRDSAEPFDRLHGGRLRSLGTPAMKTILHL